MARSDRGRLEGVPDEDVDDVLARAARLQADAQARAQTDDGRATVDEVKAVARELAIEPTHVETAIRAHNAERAATERRQAEAREARKRWLVRLGVVTAAVLGLTLLVMTCSGLLSWLRGDTQGAGQPVPPTEPRPAPTATERATLVVAPPATEPDTPVVTPTAAEPAAAPIAAEPSAAPPAAALPAPSPVVASPPDEGVAPATQTVRRSPLAPADALALRRDLEGAWDLRAYMLRDEGQWMGVPVTRAQERWLLRRAGDFEHTMGDPIAFSGKWTVTEALEGFPSPWAESRVFLLALTDVRALALDMQRPRDWHVGVLSEGDLLLFYAGAGAAPDFDSIHQGSRFARGSR